MSHLARFSAWSGSRARKDHAGPCPSASLPSRPAYRREGSVRIGGDDLAGLPLTQLRRLWGHLVCYVPQDPGTAMNPALRIRTQLAECLGTPSKVDDEALVSLLEEVQLPRHRRLPRIFSAPAFRGPIAARRDRHGLRQPPASHRHGRADDRARRHHPGACACDRATAVRGASRRRRSMSRMTLPSSPPSPAASRSCMAAASSRSDRRAAVLRRPHIPIPVL